MTEEEAWRRRIEWKLDRLAYHVTCLSLATRRPLLPPPPSRRQRVPLWPDRLPPAGQLRVAGAGHAPASRSARAGAAVGGVAGRVLKRIYAIVCGDAYATGLYVLLALTAVGALAGIV
jgi:hypothetical protein